MDLSHPLQVVTPTADGPVLSVLAHADTDFTAGQVQRLIGDISPRGARLVLDRLSDQGIVLRRQGGRAWLYRLNREHLAASAVLEIADLQAALVRRLSESVASWEQPPVYGAVFGSAAGRSHTTTSDIDLFLVRPKAAAADSWDEAVQQLAAAVTRWTGNDTRPLVLGEAEVRAWATRRERVLVDVADEGITFHGDPAWLRAHASRGRR